MLKSKTLADGLGNFDVAFPFPAPDDFADIHLIFYGDRFEEISSSVVEL